MDLNCVTLRVSPLYSHCKSQVNSQYAYNNLVSACTVRVEIFANVFGTPKTLNSPRVCSAAHHVGKLGLSPVLQFGLVVLGSSFQFSISDSVVSAFSQASGNWITLCWIDSYKPLLRS
nr:PREDICTED: uncharacterized protein LOC109032170 [Bemisia tabaci]